MKFRVMFKDPDGVYESINDTVEEQVEILDLKGELSEEIKENLIDGTREELEEFISEWIEFNEYITVEFDTEKKTCVVIPA